MIRLAWLPAGMSDPCTPAEVRQVAAAISAARDRYLVHLPVMEVIDRLDAAVNLWLDPA